MGEDQDELGKVVNIDFYQRDSMPPALVAELVRRRVKVPPHLSGKPVLVAVRTWVKPDALATPSYDFEFLGTMPKDIIRYFHKLAQEDGMDLNEVLKKAFGEGSE